MSPLSTLPKPRSKARPITRNEDPFLVQSTSPGAVVEYVSSQRGSSIAIDLEKCRCGECKGNIGASNECRFYEKRGGKFDGLRMAAHMRCVHPPEAIKVSLEAALQIFIRQSK